MLGLASSAGYRAAVKRSSQRVAVLMGLGLVMSDVSGAARALAQATPAKAGANAAVKKDAKVGAKKPTPVLPAPIPASSAQVAAEPPPEALDHYMRGRRQYLAGRYRDALTELKAALEYDRDAPDLIYNLARVYENLGELDQAIAHYQRYLQRLPKNVDPDERERTNKTIRRLEGAKREGVIHKGVQPFRLDRMGRADLAFWLTAGGAVVLFGSGAATGIVALNRNADVKNFVAGREGSLTRRKQLSDQADGLATTTDVLLLAGGATLTAAVLLFFLRDPLTDGTKHGPVQLGMQLDGQHAVLSGSYSF